MPSGNVIEVAKGQDWAVEYRIRAGDGHGKPITVTLDADASEGDSSLTIKPDHPSLSDGDVLLFGEDTLVVLADDCAAGEKTLTVAATPCSFDRGNELAKLVDLTGYAIKAVVLSKLGSSGTEIIAADDIDVTIPAQTGENYGKVVISGVAADTAEQRAGSYPGALWRTDSGETRPLDGGDGFTFKLLESPAAAFA